MNPGVCQDEFGCGGLPVVDKENNQPRDEQCGDDDSCEDGAFGHKGWFKNRIYR